MIITSEQRSTSKISVCMPISRGGPLFNNALQSVLSQSYRDFELIITDDSCGSAIDIVAPVSDKRIRYLPNQNPLGFAANHCRVIEEAEGEYVAFLHDDDAWHPEFLRSMSAVLDQHREVGFVLAGALEVNVSDEVLGPRPTRMQAGIVPNPLEEFLSRDFMMLLPSITLFRRAALNANKRPWPDVIAADITMYVDAVLAGWKVYYLDEKLVRYRIHPGQIGTDNLAHRHALVTVWTRYSFQDKHLEAARRRRLSSALLGRAGALAQRRRTREARRDLVLAFRACPSILGPKWLAIFGISFMPRLIPASEHLWRRVYDPLFNRHRG